MVRHGAWFGELTSIALVTGALSKFLPAIATIFAIWWYAIVIWESRTGQWWRARWRSLYVGIRRRRLTTEDRVLVLALGGLSAGVGLALIAAQIVAGEFVK